ncbi:MAG: chaperone modulator CbpM [Proteobacteria bacterium]|nr:chaperone modulator CbpM [Pseudomonadota bacterium]
MSDDYGKSISEPSEKLPEPSAQISWAEFVEQTQVHPSRLGELIDLGWIEPRITREELYLFQGRDVYRLRKLERICLDLGVSTVGGTIIVDLLERIERLEDKIKELEQYK